MLAVRRVFRTVIEADLELERPSVLLAGCGGSPHGDGDGHGFA